MHTRAAPSAAAPRASGGYAPLVTPETARADLAAAVRLFLLRSSLTVAQLAADAGLSERRLGRLLESGVDRRYPRLDEALSLFAAIGARDPAAGAAAASRSLDRAGLRAEVDDGAAEPLAQAVADMLEEVGEFAQCAATGGITRATADRIEHAAEQLIGEAKGVRRAARAVRGG